MSTVSSLEYKINGILDTNQSVLDNLQKLTTAAGCWLTFDIATGKWSVIINTTGTSVASFNDSNIIGGINITGTGINELYNEVKVEFPHADLNDQKDWISAEIDPADRFDNEYDNVLSMSLDIINDPVHATAIGVTELKQSRVDKIIEFRTDYSKIGLKAGDLIDITNSMYDFTAKIFRIVTITEEDGDDNNISLSITALEYDADVYNYDNLYRYDRNRIIPVPPRLSNTAADTKEDISTGSMLLRLVGSSMVTGLLNSLFSKNSSTGKVTQTISNTTTGQAVEDVFSSSEKKNVLLNLKAPPVTVTGASTICEESTLTLTVALDDCSCIIDTTTYPIDYTITGVDAADITPFALTGTIFSGALNIPIGSISAEKTLVFTAAGVSKSVTIYNKLGYTFSTIASPTSITEGASSTVTLTTTNVANGTSVTYAITGSATGKVTSPALTGTVTVNSNTASLTIVTNDDSTYTGSQSLLVTFGSAITDNCAELDKTATITVLDNDTEPPPEPPTPVDTTCEYVSVPLVWCGVYDATDEQLKDVSVRKYALLPKALAGEATVNIPMTLTITKGNPSTVAVATSVAVASSSDLAGIPMKFITTFNTVAPKGLITGSASTTVYGY